MSRSPRRGRLAVENAGKEYVDVSGSWVPAGTGTTAPTGVVGTGFTVAQSADGVFDVTFTYPYKALISFVPSVCVAGETTDATVQWGDRTAATASVGMVIRVRTMTAGTPTDFSGDSAPLVSFNARFSKS
jgi:hypothetical protein